MNNITSLFLVATFLAIFSVSDACSCLPTTLKKAYYSPNTARFVRATPIFRSASPDQNSFYKILYVLRITSVYKGCYKPKYIIVKTSASSASCGVNLQLYKSYVIPLSVHPVPTINLCQFIRQYHSLPKASKKFLNTRYVCCGKTCKCANGSAPVSCVVRPCRFAKKPCKEAVKCIDNYCGKFRAEWFTKGGKPACEISILRPNKILAKAE